MIRISVLAVLAGLLVAACGGPTQVASGGPMAGSPGTSNSSSDAGKEHADDKPLTEPAAPASYARQQWIRFSDTDEETEDALVFANVPKGWNEEKKSDFASDFVDPTGQLRLRIDASSGMPGAKRVDPQAAADAELARVRGAAGYKLVSNKVLPSSANGDVVGVVYRFDRDGTPAEATYQFSGVLGDMESGVVVVGMHYPVAYKSVGIGVLDAVTKTLEETG